MPITIRTLLFAALFAPLAAVAEEIPEAVENTANALRRGLEPDSITPTPIDGFYQVMWGPNVVYLSADGRYLFDGSLFDLYQRRNLSEEAREVAIQAQSATRQEALEKFGEETMLVYGPKDAKHTITVFTDIDCTYCRKLHKEMAEMNGLGIRVRYLAFPRAGIGSESYNKAVSVWCADDPQAAMDLAKTGATPEPATCDENPVDRHLALARSLGISSTPAIILEDGKLVRGYRPANQLLGILEGKPVR